MWTIGFAERLRFPQVSSRPRCPARRRGKPGGMLAFAHIPTGPTASGNRFISGRKSDNLSPAAARIARIQASRPRRDSLLTPPSRCPNIGVHLMPRIERLPWFSNPCVASRAIHQTRVSTLSGRGFPQIEPLSAGLWFPLAFRLAAFASRVLLSPLGFSVRLAACLPPGGGPHRDSVFRMIRDAVGEGASSTPGRGVRTRTS